MEAFPVNVQCPKFVIPRSEATWESPATGYVFAGVTCYPTGSCEIAASLRSRNDKSEVLAILAMP